MTVEPKHRCGEHIKAIAPSAVAPAKNALRMNCFSLSVNETCAACGNNERAADDVNARENADSERSRPDNAGNASHSDLLAQIARLRCAKEREGDAPTEPRPPHDTP